MRSILRSIVAVLTLASAGIAVANDTTASDTASAAADTSSAVAADISSAKHTGRCDEKGYDTVTMIWVDGGCMPVATGGAGYDVAARESGQRMEARRGLGYQEERFLRETWAALP